MKNIEAILAECGVNIPEDKKTEFSKTFGENYKTVADWQNQRDKAANFESQLNTTKEELKKFEGVNADELKGQIATLTKQLEDKETEYNSKIADRDFNDLLGEAITKYKGINSKAIKALLDVDTLKDSKNQRADVDKAVADLTKADDSKMLFGDVTEVSKSNPIGKVGGSAPANDLSKMRAIMGLPTENTNK